MVAGEYPLGFIPFDYDLLSLEVPSAFRVRALGPSLRRSCSARVLQVKGGDGVLVICQLRAKRGEAISTQAILR